MKYYRKNIFKNVKNNVTLDNAHICFYEIEIWLKDLSAIYTSLKKVIAQSNVATWC